MLIHALGFMDAGLPKSQYMNQCARCAGPGQTNDALVEKQTCPCTVCAL